MFPQDPDRWLVGWQTGSSLLAHRESAATVKENGVVALRIHGREMRQQIVDIATNAGAAIALLFSEQMGINANALTGTRRAGRKSSVVHRFRL